MTAAGLLGPDRLCVAGRELAAGDEIICLRNDRRLGVRNGTTGTIVAVDRAGTTITVDTGADKQIVIPAGYPQAGHIAHGYATTVRPPPVQLHRSTQHRHQPPATPQHLGNTRREPRHPASPGETPPHRAAARKLPLGPVRLGADTSLRSGSSSSSCRVPLLGADSVGRAPERRATLAFTREPQDQKAWHRVFRLDHRPIVVQLLESATVAFGLLQGHEPIVAPGPSCSSTSSACSPATTRCQVG